MAKKSAAKKAVRELPPSKAKPKAGAAAAKKASTTGVEAKTETKTKVKGIAKTLSFIDGLGATATIREAATRADAVQENYVVLGGLLNRIQTEKLWEGHAETFGEFVTATFGYKPRKAYYLIEAFNAIVSSGADAEAVRRVSWTKVAAIASVLTPDNWASWFKKAEKMSVRDLQEAVAEAEEKAAGKSGAERKKKDKGKTFTFKAHEDQVDNIEAALEKGQKEAGTDSPVVALEQICSAYLAGGKVQRPKSLVESMKAVGWEEALKAFEKAFPDVELTASGAAEDDDESEGEEEADEKKTTKKKAAKKKAAPKKKAAAKKSKPEPEEEDEEEDESEAEDDGIDDEDEDSDLDDEGDDEVDDDGDDDEDDEDIDDEDLDDDE